MQQGMVNELAKKYWNQHKIEMLRKKISQSTKEVSKI
jgi:hypothetical protein